MRHYKKVHEDIRAGRTELVWERDRYIYPESYWEALIDDEPLTGEPSAISILEQESNSFSVTDLDGFYLHGHPFSSYLSLHAEKYKKGLSIYLLENSTLEETKAKLQQFYNDYLLEEARKKDEQGHFQRKEEGK